MVTGLLGLGLIGFWSTAAWPDGKVYYSVHVASFKDLKNANGFVNSLARIGKVVFWKEAQVPRKGLFYRVYMGRFSDLSAAEAYWEKLREEGKVSYRGIHRFQGPILPPPPRSSETAPPPPIPETPSVPADAEPRTPEPVPPKAPPARLPSVAAHRPAGPEPAAPPAAVVPGRFVDNGDGTVTDRENGLMWVRNGWRIDFFSAETWDEAVKKCRRFQLAGHSDWRLPTLAQWRTLIDTGYECPALVDPNPFENIIVHMPYWSATPLKHIPIKAYTVTLYYGTVTHQKKSDRAFILPVRTLN